MSAHAQSCTSQEASIALPCLPSQAELPLYFCSHSPLPELGKVAFLNVARLKAHLMQGVMMVEIAVVFRQSYGNELHCLKLMGGALCRYLSVLPD